MVLDIFKLCVANISSTNANQDNAHMIVFLYTIALLFTAVIMSK